MEPHAGLAPETLEQTEALIESGELAEVIPLLERRRAARLKLPGERSIHDFELGDHVLAMLTTDSKGTRRLVAGRIDSMTEWGERVLPHTVTCDGFLNLKIYRSTEYISPGRIVGINADFGSLIPVEAIKEFKQDPDYLAAWLRSGHIDTTSRADMILAELQDRFDVGHDVYASWQGPLKPCLVGRRGASMEEGEVYELKQA